MTKHAHWFAALAIVVAGCSEPATPTPAPTNTTTPSGTTPPAGSGASATTPGDTGTASTGASSATGTASTGSNSDVGVAGSTDQRLGGRPGSGAANPGSIVGGNPAVTGTTPPAGAQSTPAEIAVVSAKRALEADPKGRNSLLGMGRALQERAWELMQSNDAARGYPMFIESASYLRTFRESFPELNPAEQSLVSMSLYNEACAHSIAKDTDKALASLKDALDAGFSDFNLLSKDPDLNSLRELEGFKVVMDAATERAEAAKKLAIEAQVANAKALLASGETFPFDFTLNDLDGNPVALADHKGKVVIADIWGTWCPPCRMEIPHFVELKEKYEADGFEIIGINYEGTEGAEAISTIKKFAGENGINYPCVIGDDATQKQVPEFQGYPTTMFIDRTGKVRAKLVGYTDIAVLEALVTTLLAEPAPAGDAAAAGEPAATEAAVEEPAAGEAS